MNLDDFLHFLIENGCRWVESQREVHRPSARALAEPERSEFTRWFESETLDRAKVKLVPVIENPDFYSILRGRGIPDPLDFRIMSGITFVDTILISQSQIPPDSRLLPLLFHELVHVVQYEILGWRAFVDRYVRGWAENGFTYSAIPLERDVYELQVRYESDLHPGFSVTAEVRRRLGFH